MNLYFILGVLIFAVFLASISDALTIRNDKVFADDFEEPLTLYEAGSMEESFSQNWWLNSGGIFFIEDGVGKTLKGHLPNNSPIRITYNISNPSDSEDGQRPQNIFRLITKKSWGNISEAFYFRVLEVNESKSSNRNETNGIFMVFRRQDDNNLYYAGIRFDGKAIVKKKVNGFYQTLAMESLYDERMPLNTWIGLKVVATNTHDGDIFISFYHDTGKTGKWNLITEGKFKVNDNELILLRAGEAGIRADFSDVEFDDFMILDISA